MPIDPNGVSRTSETIHQTVTVNASPARVYEALTAADRFTAMSAFSMVPTAPPAQIAREVGGSFSLFGGYIVGRHIELVPGQRIVQAWRSAPWAPGVYSIVHFELEARDSTTVLTLAQSGFPTGEADHLAAGWQANYWEPLKRYLEQGHPEATSHPKRPG
jgi:activator of HSP90 ATPase